MKNISPELLVAITAIDILAESQSLALDEQVELIKSVALNRALSKIMGNLDNLSKIKLKVARNEHYWLQAFGYTHPDDVTVDAQVDNYFLHTSLKKP